MSNVSSDAPTRRSHNAFRAVVIGCGLLALAACNTVNGAGKDVSAIGHNVSNGASSAKQGIVNSTGTAGQ